MAVVDFHSLDATKKKEIVLRDIYDSEELKINSSRTEMLKRTIDDLCVSGSKEFDDIFVKVCSDVTNIRKEKGTKTPLLQEMFRYQAETLPERLKTETANYGDPIFWQMIVERLFIGDNNPMVLPQCDISIREFSPVEENAIYYAAGYVIRKLLQKFQVSGNKHPSIVEALLDMISEDVHTDECSDGFLDYIKTWTTSTDRGGLIQVTDDVYLAFKYIESATYELITGRKSKADVMSGVLTNTTVLYFWRLAVDLPDEAMSTELLQEIVDLWTTMRGFSICNHLFEQYKEATKKTVKGTKGLRKELH